MHSAPPTKGVFWPDPDDGNLDTPPCIPVTPLNTGAPGPRGPASEQTYPGAPDTNQGPLDTYLGASEQSVQLGPQTITQDPLTLTQGP